MRSLMAGAGALAAAAIVLAGGSARAQQADSQGASPQRYKAQPLILQREQLGTESLANIGRTRMRNGDCPGALEAFDAAIKTSIEAGLRRDRGLCHERLGHPYPAIDDYRAYLTAQPEAPDADGIRERLRRLEDQVAGRQSEPTQEEQPPSISGSASSEGGTVSVSASTSTSTGRDKLGYIEREDDEMHTPLKRGKGWSFAPMFMIHKWFEPGLSFGSRQTWAECVGLQFRYSVGPGGTVFGEAGYEHFNSTDVDLATVAGVTSQIGYEVRLPMDSDYDNQLFIAPGLGYEHWVVTPTDPEYASVSLGAFVPRVRVGWRHLFDSSSGIDASLDGGVGNFFTYSHFPYDSSNKAFWLLGANVALLWGL